MQHRDPRPATGTQPAESRAVHAEDPNLNQAERREAAVSYARARGPVALAELARAVEGYDGMRLRPKALDAKLEAMMLATASRLRDYGVEIPPSVARYMMSFDDARLALMALHVVQLNDDEVGVDFCRGLDWITEMRLARSSDGEPS
jgi:hypothetical protein